MLSRIETLQSIIPYLGPLLLLSSCSEPVVPSLNGADHRLAELELRLSASADKTALCVEYIGLCEQGLGLCIEGDNASTYREFCSGLQARCRATTALHCQSQATDAGSSARPDTGTEPTAGPVIREVAAFDITQTSAKIRWTLSEPATGQVEYGTTSSYGELGPNETSLRYTAHEQALSNLSPGTLYHYRVRSADETGAESVSGDFSFETNKAPEVGGASSYHAPPPTSTFLVSVRDTGAVCDGVTNDTAAIQAAVDRVGGTGGTVLVPAGTCMIDAVYPWDGGAGGVALKSNMTFRMSSGAVLKAITNDRQGYAIVRIQSASDVNLIGGTIQGDRLTHRGVGGEWGMGVAIYGGSNIFVEGVTAKDCWGDGFFIMEGAVNTNFYSVLADNNRRQGMSIVGAQGVVVRDSTFMNTNGTPPAAGIDIEPDGNDGLNSIVRDVQLLNNRFIGNQFDGLQIYGYSVVITGVVVDGNTFTGNHQMGFCRSSTGRLWRTGW